VLYKKWYIPYSRTEEYFSLFLIRLNKSLLDERAMQLGCGDVVSVLAI